MCINSTDSLIFPLNILRIPSTNNINNEDSKNHNTKSTIFSYSLLFFAFDSASFRICCNRECHPKTDRFGAQVHSSLFLHFHHKYAVRNLCLFEQQHLLFTFGKKYFVLPCSLYPISPFSLIRRTIVALVLCSNHYFALTKELSALAK